MKFDIRIFTVLGALVCSVFAAPKRMAPKAVSSGVLIFQRGTKLEALQLNSATRRVLRDSVAPVDWNVSRDGRRLTFAQTPTDVDFFDAGAYRSYVFIAGFNARQKVLLAAYGRKAVYPDDRLDFRFVEFDKTGTRLIVGEDEVGQFMDSPSPHWVSLYDVRTRKRIFDSRDFVRHLPKGKVRDVLLKSLLDFPALSPDGNDIMCIATPDDGDSLSEIYTPQSQVPPTQVVHLDLKRREAQILASLDDEFSVARTTFQGNSQRTTLPVRILLPQFAWHPTQKRFVFVGPTSPTNPMVNLFAFDLPTKKLSRLTSSNVQDDFSPRWSLDGKQLFWIRGNVNTEKSKDNQIFRADADGSNAAPILPQLRGVTRIQLLPKIADWSRYRNLAIEPLAGKDK